MVEAQPHPLTPPILADVEASKGKMIYTICDELTGLCHTDWKYPDPVPSGSFNVTNEKTGEVKTVYAYCGKGTYWDKTTILCELTEEEKEKIRQTYIGLGIAIGLVGTIIAIIIMPKNIKEFLEK